jgi:hypothetical protein
MLEIKNENNIIHIIISNPSPEETEIIERAKACQAGIPFQRRRQTKEEIKNMFSKFRCNQSRGEVNQESSEEANTDAAPISQIPDIPDKYFAPVDEVPDDDYPF